MAAIAPIVPRRVLVDVGLFWAEIWPTQSYPAAGVDESRGDVIDIRVNLAHNVARARETAAGRDTRVAWKNRTRVCVTVLLVPAKCRYRY